MRRGEVWWVEFDGRRPFVLVSDEEPAGFRAMQVVPASGVDLGGLGVEVAVGGLPFDGVLRFGFPRPGFTPCTWLTTLPRDALLDRAATLSPATLDEIDEALRAEGQQQEWTPTAAARFDEIRDAVRRGAFG